jgi:hypothetical protein
MQNQAAPILGASSLVWDYLDKKKVELAWADHFGWKRLDRLPTELTIFVELLPINNLPWITTPTRPFGTSTDLWF